MTYFRLKKIVLIRRYTRSNNTSLWARDIHSWHPYTIAWLPVKLFSGSSLVCGLLRGFGISELYDTVCIKDQHATLGITVHFTSRRPGIRSPYKRGREGEGIWWLCLILSQGSAAHSPNRMRIWSLTPCKETLTNTDKTKRQAASSCLWSTWPDFVEDGDGAHPRVASWIWFGVCSVNVYRLASVTNPCYFVRDLSPIVDEIKIIWWAAA